VRTSTRLADGREIIYFDDVLVDRSAVDIRELEPFAPAAELRHDLLHDEPVLIAAHRQNRTFQPAPGACPLCPGEEIPGDGYHVVSFENRFPSLGGPAGGRCEVVCFTDDHDGSFGALSRQRLSTVGAAWADRTAELGKLPGVEYVAVFENRGAEIGATLSHPHGQIYAFPYVPPTVARVRESAARFGEGCVVCHLAATAGPRLVAETGHFLAFVPEAARWPYEAYVTPRTCVPDLAALAPERRDELIGLYANVLRRFDLLFGDPVPYMAVWYQTPVRGEGLSHLYARIYTPRRTADKLKFLASSETGFGAFINDVLPERSAALLKEVM
jgi:UDPglucose--hexose-1-phosphate uridylyltransferase